VSNGNRCFLLCSRQWILHSPASSARGISHGRSSWRFRYHYHTTLQTVQVSRSTCLDYPTRLRPCSRPSCFYHWSIFLSTRRMLHFLETSWLLISDNNTVF
jgi:hypothetical protein